MKLLKNKKGVTVLEGVIALGLLAVVTAGAFGVLLSAARKSSQPDMREEMMLAVEKVKDRLQVYLDSSAKGNLPAGLTQGLCPPQTEEETADQKPLELGEHQVKCKLPIICDKSNSEFKYEVTTQSVSSRTDSNTNQEGGSERPAKLCKQCELQLPSMDTLQIKFTIKCNGYEL